MGKGIVKLGEGNWAVKDGNLLAAKETNGRFKNAEFTVARGTRATYVGRDGLIKESNLQDVNLVTNGDFTTSGIPDTSSYTLGWYSNTDGVEIANGKLTLANDASGAANAYATDGVSSTNILTTNKIYKLTFDITDNTNCSAFQIYQNAGSFVSVTNTVGSYTYYITNTSNSLFLFRNNTVNSSISLDNVSVKEVKTDTPRIDFTDNTDGHLLLEPQSTNLITYSDSLVGFGGAASKATDNTILNPEGGYGAVRVSNLLGGSGDRLNKNVTITPSETYTGSIYYKGDGSNIGKTISFYIKRQAGTLSSSSIVEVTLTNEWQRVEMTNTFLADNTLAGIFVYNDSDTATEVLLWGAQMEELPNATSYIPTNGSTVTRDAETCTGAGEAIDFNSEEGVLYVEIAALANDLELEGISLSDGGLTNRVVIFKWSTSNGIRARVTSNGSNVFNSTTIVTDIKSFNKIGLKYKENDFALWINGVEVLSDASGAIPIGLNTLDFTSSGVSGSPFYGKCKAIKVYKEALSDTDLQNLTS